MATSGQQQQEESYVPVNDPSSSNYVNYQSTQSAASSVASSINTETEMVNNEANRLSEKLVECEDDDAKERIVLRYSFSFRHGEQQSLLKEYNQRENRYLNKREAYEGTALPVRRGILLFLLFALALSGLVVILAVFPAIRVWFVGPPTQPIGPYDLVEIQEGQDFFNHYSFYDGKDSEGSNGYINYVSREDATKYNIANVTFETTNKNTSRREPFVYMSTSPTAEGPRNSIRLEGYKRYNRGLFILDVRHMPSGCGSWPAFWLTDEPAWPINGEIDILEGVNTQTDVKTAMHTTKGCKMDDVPVGVKTGYWDTAQGVPMKNGHVDMTIREARDCFVYDPHQWLNQGCVAISDQKGSIGEPLNEKGGGIFALEWDPVNRHISSFAFPYDTKMPQNLLDAVSTATLDPTKRIRPDPRQWGLPYAYFPIGEGTNCAGKHFNNMHLVFNLALCGSVAGNRFFEDCPKLNATYGSCNKYIDADTPAMNELYWKIRGVYVYEREWEKAWVH